MALILNIHTALENGFVGLAENDVMIGWQSSADQKEHASFLQPAIDQLIKDAGKKMKDIDAVAVAIGPGSYTGLRVGLASAKGLCYALQIPLIAINTLEIIASDAIRYVRNQSVDIEKKLFCPMIDARRMEVFTALYDCFLHPIINPVAKILDENSFFEALENNKIVFSGNGMEKFKNICNHTNAIFIESGEGMESIATLAFKAYQAANFSDVAYSEPFYAKAFHSTQPAKIKDNFI